MMLGYALALEWGAKLMFSFSTQRKAEGFTKSKRGKEEVRLLCGVFVSFLGL
jgi:hypothetical protein